MSVNSKRLYLRGLHQDVTEEELYKFLSAYGRITEVKVLTNYAFVQFETEMDASLVLETYQRIPLLGNRVVVEYSYPLRKDMRSFSSSNTDNNPSPSYRMLDRYPVIVTGIPPGVGWQELKDFGRLSGRMVAFCDVDKTQQGSGFIEYFSSKDAQKAARSLDGRYLGGKPVRVIEHEAIRNLPRGRLLGASGSRFAERHRLQYRSNATRHKNVENMAQMYHPTRMPEPHDTDRIWDSYDSRASGPKGSSRQGHIVLHHGIAESSYERVSSWASKCRSRPYTPNSFYQVVRSLPSGLEDEYRQMPHGYDFV